MQIKGGPRWARRALLLGLLWATAHWPSVSQGLQVGGHWGQPPLLLLPHTNKQREGNSYLAHFCLCLPLYLLGFLAFGGASQVGAVVKNPETRILFDPWIGKIAWSRKCQPAPIFLPEKFLGQKSLAGYSPCSHKESDTTEHLDYFSIW